MLHSSKNTVAYFLIYPYLQYLYLHFVTLHFYGTCSRTFTQILHFMMFLNFKWVSVFRDKFYSIILIYNSIYITTANAQQIISTLNNASLLLLKLKYKFRILSSCGCFFLFSVVKGLLCPYTNALTVAQREQNIKFLFICDSFWDGNNFSVVFKSVLNVTYSSLQVEVTREYSRRKKRTWEKSALDSKREAEIWPAPTDTRHSNVIHWGLLLLRREWLPTTTQAGPWWLVVTTWEQPRQQKPDRDKDSETEEGRRKRNEQLGHTNLGPLSCWDPKKMLLKENKNIFFFIYFVQEKSKIQIYSTPPVLPFTQTFSQTSSWQSVHSFSHLCSRWERTVIKLLIAWTFLCISVKKR